MGVGGLDIKAFAIFIVFLSPKCIKRRHFCTNIFNINSNSFAI